MDNANRDVEPLDHLSICHQIALALSYIPALHVEQLAQIADVHPSEIEYAIAKEIQWFERRPYRIAEYSPYRVSIPAAGAYVRLSKTGEEELTPTATPSSTAPGTDDIARMFRLGDVLVSLRVAGLGDDAWRLSMAFSDGLDEVHAMLIGQQLERLWAVHLIPDTFGRKGVIGRLQTREVQSLLATAVMLNQPFVLLTPGEHVSKVQELVNATDVAQASMKRVWPLESFMESPIDYLDQLQTRDA